MAAVIDAHQHFWDPARDDYPLDAGGPLHRPFEPDHLQPELAVAGVDASVLVQAVNTHRHTGHLLELADRHPFVAGVVGWAPLERPSGTAEALDRIGAHPKLRGARHLVLDPPDSDWLAGPGVADSLRLLAEAGLAWDIVAVTPRQLGQVAALAGRVTGLRAVVDHLGNPPVVSGGWEPWASQFARLREHEHVYVKLSAGLHVVRDWPRFSGAALRPYVEHALRCVGAQRLMFASNWPVVLLAGDYQLVREQTEAAVDGLLDPAGHEAVFGGTARRCYGLEL